MLPIDLAKVPFSRYGSYLAISKNPRDLSDARLFIRCLHGNIPRRELFEIRIEDGYALDVQPHLLTIQTKRGDIHAYFRGSDELVLFGDCKRFTLSYLNAGQTGYVFAVAPGRAHRVVERQSLLFGLWQAAKGNAELHADWQLKPGETGSPRLCCTRADIKVSCEDSFALLYRMQEQEGPADEALCIDTQAEVAQARAQYAAWAALFPKYAHKYEETAQLIQYILWSAAVYPAGHFKRDAILMSKNWMCSLWCWDNCFNSMALAPYAPDLAFDQIRIPFDNQADSGKIPDRVDDRMCQAIYTKPPAMGWAYLRMVERGFAPDAQTLLYLREKMIRVLNWWFTLRDDDGDGICQYNHGNESGWDNSSAFDEGVPVESPDLTAFILLDYIAIAEISKRLGDTQAQEAYARKYGELFEKFVGHGFDEQGLPVVTLSGAHKRVETRSALPLGAIVLGQYMPAKIADALAQAVRRDFLDEFGVATEALGSGKFFPGNSYWRGPSWASLNYQLADGLRRAGKADLAKEIARRVCDAVALQGTAYENYNAHTGEGYDDPAYTWMASVFLLFLDEYFRA